MLIGALALLVTGGLGGVARVSRATASSEGEPFAQTDDSVPAQNVIMLGSTPLESEGETWGIGEGGSLSSGAWTIVRYSTADGWTRAPEPVDASGQPLARFEPDRTPLTGAFTATGAGVLLGTVKATHQVILVRNPGGTFQEAPLPSSGEAALTPEEELFSTTRTPLVAPLDENGHAGAFLVPVNKSAAGAEESVLHWDGASGEWTREPIELPKASKEVGGFRVLAVAASSPQNAWILAQLSAGSPDVALFRRREATWKEVLPAPLTVDGQPSEPFTVVGAGHEPPSSISQILTVTDQGVWLDGQRSDAGVPVTMFFKPNGEEPLSGEVTGSWCNAPASFAACKHTLPDALPAVHLRSFAWANSSTPFGERVITGLGEGVSLRLEGESFVRVISLGGSEAPNDVGGSLGAAFSEPREGWLGNEALPVHLTRKPAPSKLIDYPVPFRHALAAVAPQPEAPVGALSSQALAVGDEGEVARYEPGEGWQPESLPDPGGGVSTKRMRAVAWPTAARAFAVGEEGEMWLWRGETGFWEPDPATPLNFRADLLGIAFDPANPSRGYAVGQQGALLHYGKTWVQEEGLPGEAVGASFTSIAFAGSEALVAFRLFHQQSGGEPSHYSGGVLVNSGSGWHLDEGLQQALRGRIPWAVAGLADGGAAVSATPDGLDEVPAVLERNGPGQSWQEAPAYPGVEAPGSLALFREGGSLRAVGSGGMPNTLAIDDERPPPAGFPPPVIKPYPLASGYIVRQTANGWSDEEHERNHAQDPLGEYKFYDLPYQPDPTAAVLIDPTGSQGWAVGGAVNSSTPSLDTADVARYPNDGVSPPGVGSAPLQASSSSAAFAVAGGAECLAPCADRANARLGPDVWFSSALGQASQIGGVRAFLYTGPRVTTGVGHGSVPVPYSREFARYAAVLSGPLPTYAVASPSDRGPGNECEFQQVFPYPWALPGGESCPSYYAIESPGPAGTVRVIMLDASGEVESTQLGWLAGELREARANKTPAIVLGNADLNAEIAAGQGAAAAVAQTLVEGEASAYFYDSPEQNVQLPLRVGTKSIPTFGSGTLGYVSATNAQKRDFIGQMGFLLAQVEAGRREPGTENVAPVKATLVPNIGELAMEATEGVILHRSAAALFAALARRPRAGGRASRGSTVNESTLYVPIPSNCVGSDCASGIEPEFTFSSSRPDIGNFVEPNLATGEAKAVLLEHEEPVPDSKSGLFCAFNAGKTVVTISAGGLSASLDVTVQAGSVRRPCGTTPLKEIPAQQQVTLPPPAPAPGPAPTGSAPPSSAPPPVPVPAPPAPASPTVAPPAAHPAPKPPSPFLVPPVVAAPLLPFVPLPVPTPARPTPPSGTSAVTSPIEAAEKEEEQEEAPESVSNKAVAYRSSEHEPSPVYLLGLVLLAAFAGASVRRRPRGGRRSVQVAPATVSAMRAQRRMEREQRRLP